MAKIVLYESRIRIYMNRPRMGWAARATWNAAGRVMRKAKRIAPVDTGLLAASIHRRPTFTVFGPSAVVGSNVNYAILVHEGTGIYGPRGRPITAVRARAMRFTVKGGKTVFAISVRGTRPNRFLKNALDAVL